MDDSNDENPQRKLKTKIQTLVHNSKQRELWNHRNGDSNGKEKSTRKDDSKDERSVEMDDPPKKKDLWTLKTKIQVKYISYR